MTLARVSTKNPDNGRTTTEKGIRPPVQFQDATVYVSIQADSLGKGINPSDFLQNLGPVQRQTAIL